MTNWESLPVEVLQLIFRETDKEGQCNLVRVCKAWLHPAQARLYSNIEIEDTAQLKKFRNAVEHNINLGKLVKVFKVNISMDKRFGDTDKASRSEIFNIVTSLLYTHLPNLVQYGGRTRLSYTPVLHALLNSHLNRLNILEVPRTYMFTTGEITNYVTCAFLMKDRLENILISDELEYKDEPPHEQIFFDRLYDKLHQFEKLKEIDITRRTTKEIQELEYVLNNCKSLKKLKYNFIPRNHESLYLPLNRSISIDAISRFTPRPDIESLHADMIMENDYKNLLYIMRKFPRLRDIHLNIKNSKLSTKLSRHILSQLLIYLSGINRYDVSGLTADHEVVTDCIGNFWKATSGLGEEKVELSYTKYQPMEVLDVSNRTGFGKYKTEIEYPSPNPEYKHMDFVEKNGRFIKHLLLAFSTDYIDYTERGVLPEDCLPQILRHCPDLLYLSFEQWILKRPTNNFSKLAAAGITSVSFNSLCLLRFDRCTIEQGVLPKMSLFFEHIHRFSLNRVRSADWEVTENENGGTEIFHVDMPYTKICKVELDYSFADNDPIYVQLYANDKLFYYRYDFFEVGYCKRLSKQEYMKVGNHRYIYIRCATKPRIAFEENDPELDI